VGDGLKKVVWCAVSKKGLKIDRLNSLEDSIKLFFPPVAIKSNNKLRFFVQLDIAYKKFNIFEMQGWLP